MKRYEFRMAKVLRVRRLQEDAARAAVAHARRAEQAAVAAADAARAHYDALHTPDAPSSLHEFLAQRAQGDLRAAALHTADHRRRDAVGSTATAVDQWHGAHRRVDALERLDGRRREEYGIELRRHEDAVVDELVTMRAGRTA